MSRSAVGSRTSRINSSSSAVGQRRGGDRVGNHELEAGGLDDVVDVHPGCTERMPHGVVGSVEVEDPEVGHHHADVVEARGGRPGRGGAVVADAAHHVDVLDEAARRVGGNPVARGVVEAVARSAPHPDELRLGPGPVADGAEVLVAEAVDLRRHHHDVAPARPHHVEHPPVGHPRLEHELGRAATTPTACWP